MIWMFLNQIQFEEDVKFALVVVDLVNSMIFYMIFPFTKLATRE